MPANDKILDLAAIAAIGGFREFCKIHALGLNAEHYLDRIIDAIRLELPRALDDAREAAECGMTDIARRTFLASMVLAGIDVAKSAQAMLN